MTTLYGLRVKRLCKLGHPILRWTLIAAPNNMSMRSVLIEGNRIIINRQGSQKVQTGAKIEPQRGDNRSLNHCHEPSSFILHL
jgi:hypothetical protein